MARINSRLESSRRAYREALDAARANPTPEAWAKLLEAGKDLSAAAEPRRSSGRRSRRSATAEAPSEEPSSEDPSSFRARELEGTIE